MLLRIVKKINQLLGLAKYKILYGKAVTFGKKVKFKKAFRLTIDGGRLTIGDRVSFNHDCSISCVNRITIGDDCLFGEGVKIYDHNHIFSRSNELIRDQGLKKGTVTIGRNCWIGSNVVILNNVAIGDNVVVGAGCVVRESVPSGKLLVEKNRNEVLKIFL